MFAESFKITVLAVGQTFILGAIGYFMVKRKLFGDACLNSLSRLVMDVTLPLLIFCQLIRNFSFAQYPNWWKFPLLSLLITAIGLAVGMLFSVFTTGDERKRQLISLVGFQNSGYLPLALITALLPQADASTMFIYVVLFLAGFNLAMFSLGVYILTAGGSTAMHYKSFLNAPVVATVVTLFIVALGFAQRVPDFVLKPVTALGECTIPLAIFIVGGNLAQIRLNRICKKEMALMFLAKLIVLPLLGILAVMAFNFTPLVGLLIVMQLAVPPAVTSAAIIRTYSKEDVLISQGIFIGHVAAILTLPVFLSWYFMLRMIQ